MRHGLFVASIGSSLLLWLLAGVAVPASPSDAVLADTVTRVIDADTVVVALSSGPIRVRLHGIDAPEKKQAGGEAATAALAALVLQQRVELEPIEQDRYERLVAILFVGDVNINQRLVELGHAWAYRRYLRKSDAVLCRLEAGARTRQRGVWAAPSPVAPWEYRQRARTDFTNYADETEARCIRAMGQRPGL